MPEHEDIFSTLVQKYKTNHTGVVYEEVKILLSQHYFNNTRTHGSKCVKNYGHEKKYFIA